MPRHSADKVREKRPEKLRVCRSERRRDLAEGVAAVADGVKVDLLDDVDARQLVGVPAADQPAHRLLEGRGCCAAAVDLAVEDGGEQQVRGELVEVRRHQGRRVHPGEAPAEVAGGVAHVGAGALGAGDLLVQEGLQEQREHDGQEGGEQQGAPVELCEGQERPMPSVRRNGG